MSVLKPIPYFEKNLGQLPSDIKYKMKANDYITFFKEDELMISLPSNIENTRNTFYMNLENKNNQTYIKGECKEEGIVSYYIGNDPSKWITNIPTYSKIKYEGVYNNIDLYYYVNNRNLEYDFVLYKGANPEDICISFEGINNIEINEDENIVLTVGDVKAILLKPKVYQIIDNQKVNIECKYSFDSKNHLNFIVDNYDKEYELVLDPVLQLDYSTYVSGVGGDGFDYARAVAVDTNGRMIVVGYTDGNYLNTWHYEGGIMDAFITKMDVEYGLRYAMYLGGNSDDYATAVVLDSEGNSYVTGGTRSSDFPMRDNAYNTTYLGNGDAFVAVVTLGGYLAYCTFLGGTDYNIGYGIALDSKGDVYVTGKTENNFPITINAYQLSCGGKTDAFVSKLDSKLSTLKYSTYIGGNGYDSGNGIVVDSDGCAYITGYAGVNFPTTKGAFQTLNQGDTDVFISKLSSDGSSLIYSTYIGGSRNDGANAIAIDSEGCAYIAGYSWSSDYPTVNLSHYYSENKDMIVSKLSADGSSLIYSTYIGGPYRNNAYGIAIDSKGCAYLTGVSSGNLFVCKVSSDGSSYDYHVICYGHDNTGRGIAIDKLGYIYITGYAKDGYPTTEDAYRTTFAGNFDVVLSKLFFVDYDLSFEYIPSKVKLLDNIKTKLILKNLSIVNLDFNIKYQTLDSSVEFVPNSLSVQNTVQISNTIPKSIYLSDIFPEKTVEIELSLKYINEKFPDKIPIIVTVEAYYNKFDKLNLGDTKTETFYIDTTIGPNYIYGCNKDLYNLTIDGVLQVSESGTPIIYYKSGESYIYTEASEGNYVYKVLSNVSNVVEYLIGT